MPDACPDDNTIDQFVAGAAGEAEQTAVRAHLQTCRSCRTLVSSLVRGNAAAAPEPDPDVDGEVLFQGARLSRYVILDLIGSGAMGRVYSAYDPQLDRRVALKLVHPRAAGDDPSKLRGRMLREAQAMARLVHPNVVAVHDAGETASGIHIAMELVEGKSVRAWLAAAPRPWREILSVFVQAGRGLAAAHHAGLVHRDLKPDNILIADSGRVLIGDFGMASVGATEGQTAGAAASLSLTQTGALMGTPAYMAPEQLTTARVDARADVYAFAVSAWEALLDVLPFRGDDLASLRAEALTGKPREPPTTPVPRRIRRALAGAFDPDPERRPSLDALLGVLAADPRRQLLRIGAALAIAGALVLLVLAGRAALLARAATQRAEARATTAVHIGERLNAAELGLQNELLLPLHDLRPGEAKVRAGIAELRALLDGSPADAPIHAAIGRALALLGDHEGARVELEIALRDGAGDADLHWVMGNTLIRLHAAAVAAARRMGGPAWVTARKAALDAEYLPAARTHLDAAAGTALAPPEQVAALIAYQAGDLDAALAAARSAARASPLNHEAQLLVGQILYEQSDLARETGNERAEALLTEAIDELEAAALTRRSDPAVFDAIAEAWVRRLDRLRWQGLAERMAVYHLALLAAYRELAAVPRSARAEAHLAHAHAWAAPVNSSSPPALIAHTASACTAQARLTSELDPGDAISLDIEAVCLFALAQLAEENREDSTPMLHDAVAALRAAQQVSPGFPWAANDLGIAYILLADDCRAVGCDVTGFTSAAIDAERKAMALDPGYEAPRNNLAWACAVRASGRVQWGVWDGDAEACAEAAAHGDPPLRESYVIIASVGNLLVLHAARLEYAAASGADTRAAADQLAAGIAEMIRVAPAAEDGEIVLMILEARATLAVVRAEAGGGPLDRGSLSDCVARQPGRLECRLLEVRADWIEGNAERARARAEKLTRDFPRSGRALAALAEAERRLGHTEAGIRAAEAALARAPSPLVYAILGQLEASRARDAGGAGRALAALDRAVAMNPLLAARLAGDRAAMVEIIAAGRR